MEAIKLQGSKLSKFAAYFKPHSGNKLHLFLRANLNFAYSTFLTDYEYLKMSQSY